MKLKSVYSDYEDDLLLATAQIAGVDYLVTNDAVLLSKSVVPSITPKDLLAYLKALEEQN